MSIITARQGFAHKINDINAKFFYQQTIGMTKDNPWYFGANSALQLGYIFQAAGDTQSAWENFEKALSYKKHEYKNSIEAKQNLFWSAAKEIIDFFCDVDEN